MNKLHISLFVISILLSINVHGQVSDIIAPDPTPQVSLTESGKSSSQRINYVSQYSDPTIIKKTINPLSDDKYSIQSPLCISLEIKNNKNDRSSPNLKHVYVREIIDNDLCLIEPSLSCIKVSHLDEISDYKLDLFRYSFDNPDNEMYKYNKIKQDGVELYKNDDLICSVRPREVYILNFNNISINKTIFPNNCSEDDKILLRFLRHNYGISWAECANHVDNRINITKHNVSNSDKNISYIKLENKDGDLVTITMDYMQKRPDSHKAILEIYDGRKYELTVKEQGEILQLIDLDNIIEIYTEQLSPKEYILLKYSIKPKRYGIFNTETIIRTYDSKYLYSPDMEYPLNIEVKEPKPDFEVRSSRNMHEIVEGETIKVTYYITYLGGASEPIYDNVSLKLDISDKVKYYDENNTEIIETDIIKFLRTYNIFRKGYTTEIPLTIEYTASGIYPLPGIWINGVHYTFEDERTTVKTNLEKHKDLILGVLLVFFLFIASKTIDVYRDLHFKRFSKTPKVEILIYLAILFCVIIIIFIIAILLK